MNLQSCRTLLVAAGMAIWGMTALPARGAGYDIAALVYPGYHPDPRWQRELGIFHEGIGEWQNVKEAKPKWPGHYQPRAPLKFLTFNIWGDYFENPVEEREAGVEATILKDRPDVVSLQEVTPNWYGSPLFAHLERAGYALVRGDEDAALARAAFEGEKTPAHINHEPLLYRKDRLNLLDSGTDFFHLSLQKSKSVTWAVLERKSDGRRFVAFATHFWWQSNGLESEAVRELNARHVLWLLADIRRRWGAALPAILGGDLNSTETSFAHAMLRSGGFANAASNADVRSPHCSHHGNPTRGADGKYHGSLSPASSDVPARSIDHVFYTKGIHALRHEIGTDQVALDVSDHSPVLVEFELDAR